MKYLLMAFFAIYPIANIIEITDGIGLATISGGLVLLCTPFFFIQKVFIRRERLHLGSPFLFFTGLFAFCALSGLWAYDQDAYAEEIIALAQTFVFLLIADLFVSNQSDVDDLLKAYVIGTLILAAIIFVSFLLGSVDSNPFATAELGRYSLAGADPNIKAMQMNIGIAIILGHAVMSTNRAANFAMVGLLILAIVLTGSRTGFLCMVAIITIFIFYQVSFRQALLQWIIVAVCFTAVYSLWDFRNSSIDLTRFENMVEDGVDTDLAGREYIWPKVLTVFIDNPVAGLGYGTFAAYHSDKHGSDQDAHNTHLNFLAETGLIGYILFLCVYGLIPKYWRALHNRDLQRTYAAIFVTLLMSSITLNLAQYFTFWIFVVLMERTVYERGGKIRRAVTAHHNEEIEDRLERLRRAVQH
ncbi:MAG: O-antigen ligase family protein [Pseudomonadota bacterium]